MPLPLVPIIAALSAGGTLVPHAAGGLIVTSAGGYVAGTFLSTATITTILAGSATIVGAGAAALTGAAASAIGSAGIFGTTLGATGITGALMSAGIISSTPIWIPVAIGGATLGLGFGAVVFYKLRGKVRSTPAGQEAIFTESEAKIVERILRIGAKPATGGGEA
jgi:hypothetical protein